MANDGSNRIKKIKVAGAEYDIMVEKDWNQTNADTIDFIKNKPFQSIDPNTLTVSNGTLGIKDDLVSRDSYSLAVNGVNDGARLELYKNNASDGTAYLIKGEGDTEVTADASGNITIKTELPAPGDLVTWDGDYTNATGVKIGTLTIGETENDVYAPAAEHVTLDGNTKYSLVVGDNTGGELPLVTEGTPSSMANPYLNLIERDSGSAVVASQYHITGTGNTTVTIRQVGDDERELVIHSDNPPTVQVVDEINNTTGSLTEIRKKSKESYEQDSANDILNPTTLYLVPIEELVLEDGLNSTSTTAALTANAGKTLNETKANKSDVYTIPQVNALLTAVEGGSSESASSVKRSLDSYIIRNDTEIYGQVLVTSWTNGTEYEPNYDADSRIDLVEQAAQNAQQTAQNAQQTAQNAQQTAEAKATINQVRTEIENGVGLKENLTVQLGENGSVGGYTTNTVINAGTPFEDILKQILQKRVLPTYTEPKLTLSWNGPTTYEIGSDVTGTITATFYKNSGGEVKSITFNGNKTTELVQLNNSNTWQAYFVYEYKANVTPWQPLIEEILQDSVTFTAEAEYEAGATIPDNLGEITEDNENQFDGSTKATDTITFNSYREGCFYGTFKDTLDADFIRQFGHKTGRDYEADPLDTTNFENNTIKITIEDTDITGVFVACPKYAVDATQTGGTETAIKVYAPDLNYAELNNSFQPYPETDPVTGKTGTISIPGANDVLNIAYNVWVYTPDKFTVGQKFVIVRM